MGKKAKTEQRSGEQTTAKRDDQTPSANERARETARRRRAIPATRPPRARYSPRKSARTSSSTSLSAAMMAVSPGMR